MNHNIDVATRWDGKIVTPELVIDSGSLVTVQDQIVWVGSKDSLPQQYSDAFVAEVPDGSYILPGMVDVHCHGGGGASFPDSKTLDDVRVAANEHLRHGTTTLVASLVTAPVDVLEQRASLLAEAVKSGIVAGIHFEGPFLSEVRCGAQDPRYLIPATPDVARKLVAASAGAAYTMTIAPEMCEDEAGREALEILIDGGILPSWGHTDCSGDQVRNSIEFGVAELSKQATKVRGGRATATHLFNGMRPIHHRTPGPIPALLASAKRGELVVEMINDGIHLAPDLVSEVLELVGRDNAVFVTDAMAAAGMSDGMYVLGPQAVRVESGVARLAEGDAIAGGTSHLLDCVRVAVTKGLIGIVDATYLASAQGAEVLGLKDRGRLETGYRADMVITDAALNPSLVVRGGEVVV